MCPQHDHCYSSAARHPTSARPKSKNDLEKVPETSLGTDGSGRLLYHRGVDKQRTDALSRSVLHRTVHQKDRDRGNCLAREWSMDESSRPQRGRCGGRHPKWQALSDPRSRSALHRGISKHSEQCRRQLREVAAAITQSKCTCRAVCQIHQGIVLEPPDTVW